MRRVENKLQDRVWLLFALVAAVAAVVLLYAGRDLNFHYDEWDFITGRRGFTTDTLLRGHNGHLSLVPVLYYKAMLQVIGLGTYWPYRLALVLLHLGVGTLVLVLLRRRVGGAAALVGATLVLLLGAAFEDLIWAFQFGFVFSVLTGLAALVALDANTRRGNIAAASAVVLSIASSSMGAPFVVFVTAELAARRQWRRLAGVVGPTVVLYGLWYLRYGGSELTSDNWRAVPSFSFDMLAAAAAGAAGLVGSSAGASLAVLAILGAVVASVRRPLGARAVAALVAIVVLLVLTALARAQFADPQASRYIYISVVLLLLLAAELMPDGWSLPASARPAAVALLAFALWGNLAALSAGSRGLRDIAQAVRPEISAVELARDSVPSGFQPDVERAPQIIAARYLDAVDAFGSPALNEGALAAAPPLAREYADNVLRKLEPPVLTKIAVPSRNERSCRVIPPDGEAVVPTAGVTVAPTRSETVTLRTRRYGAGFGESTGLLTMPATRIQFPQDRGTQVWTVALTGTSPVRVCD